MTNSRLACFAAALLAGMPAAAGVFPDAPPANRPAAGALAPRILSLGEPRFSDTALYNLFDQGGSPMGLLESRKERLGLGLSYLGAARATPGDSLTLEHGDLAVPHLVFVQPGLFAASLYYLRESETYRQTGVDTSEVKAHLFGLDMAAGPSSGLFRVGFSAHARLGGTDYPGGADRILVSAPSLRLDLGSRPIPGLELGAFVGVGGRFDSLRAPTGDLERIASMTIPRYGLLADVGGFEELPLMGNVVLEFGVERFLGEYRPANGTGVQYPTVFTDYWTFQTQWLYPYRVEDFLLQPALRFAHRSEKAQAYEGIKGNQDPFKKGPKLDSVKADMGITAFGLGGQLGFRDMISLLLEWETAGHTLKSDSTRKERYNRFTVGLEHHVDRLPVDFPESIKLALRAGWTWRQDAGGNPGFRDFQFQPFIPSPDYGARSIPIAEAPGAPAAYSAFTLGFGLGLLEERIGIDGYLGFPGRPEPAGIRNRTASGTEFGFTAAYRMF